ncbi:helix-turn-helix transcriptional regulator [Fontisphaera persica]|uniref:helix-turn-helix domain-containing protein n=1 Tax=Fontisphaera persica TaxID=2974023 RepID=UPI0024C0CCA6|nr:helix-turn-helix transcriptional regulator [Fontisphaera persica]WCJ58989.1 helix-turn-helix transcriptional regulator [Fontisphaera persica]
MSPAAREFVAWMQRLGWSQSETARQLLVTPSHINQIVRGKAEPSAAMLQLLRLTASRLGEGAEALAPGREMDLADQFWRELRRQRLDLLPAEEQREFLKAWARVLGIEWPRRRTREGQQDQGRR